MAGPIVQPGRQWGRYASLVVTPLSALPPIVVNPEPSLPGVGPHPLHIAFEVSKSVTPEPQRARVQLSNLSKATRDLLATVSRSTSNAQALGPTIDKRAILTTIAQVRAGYLGLAPGALITGNMGPAMSEHVGTDWITTITVGDAEATLAQAQCERSFEAGTPALEVLRYAAQCMGLVLAPQPIPAGIGAYVLARGFVAYAKARDVVDAMLAGIAPDLGQLGFVARGVAIGSDLFDAFIGHEPLTRPLTWWVEDGAIYFLERGSALPAPPVLVSATGEPGTVRLIERPERLENGAVRVVTLLHPVIRIGRSLTIKSKELAGAYRVESVVHRGDNRGGDFTSTADVRPLF